MEHRFTRQELYDRVWSTPMTRVASELGATTAILASLLKRADIPTPGSGYWMKKEFGKPVERPPLPAAPTGCPDVLVLDTEAAAKPARKPKVPASAAVADPPAAAEPSPRQASAEQAAPPAPPRATQPTTLTREELYAAVWETPMARLAERYGVSGNGLAKICGRANIPYPPRGYWAKHAAGKAAPRPPLPAKAASTKITIRPTPPPEPAPNLPPDLRRQVDDARAKAASIAVPERLVRPHPIVAGWLADHEEQKRQARRERDPWRKGLIDPGEYSAGDRRQHRLLDALFKAIERQGGKISQGERRELFAEVTGEKVEFQLREKHKHGRRPLTSDEQRWRVAGGKDWKQELLPTGRLVFDIKTYLPAGLKRQWMETDAEPLESLLPDIVATFVAAGPLLVQQRRDREAAERERQLAERRRYEEQQRRKRDANQWRSFREMAEDWRDLGAVRDFIATLRSLEINPELEVEGRSLNDWLSWAEDWLQHADPTTNGIESVFRKVGAIREWSYRD